MKASFKSLLLFLFVVAFVFTLGMGSSRLGLFNVASISIDPMSGEGGPSFFAIKERLIQKLGAYIDEPIYKVGLDEIALTVKSERWVKNVRVSRKIPNEFQVLIEPKEIAALVRKKDQVFPVAVDGSLLTPLKNKVVPDAPYLSGVSLEKEKDLRRRAIGILELLPEDGLFSQSSVSEFLYDEKKGFVAVVNNGGFEILLGPKTSVKKVNQVAQVLTYVQSKGVNARVIDARLSKKVLVRPRNAP